MISSVVVIGSGNVAFHLIRHFQTFKLNVKTVFSRTEESLSKLNKLKGFSTSTDISKIMVDQYDLIVLAVSDSSIKEVANKLTPQENSIVVHTSGATPIEVLGKASRNTGVFYPLQTFSRDSSINFPEIPVCIEASNNETLEKLVALSTLIGYKSYKVNSVQRLNLHLAAVFVNNFTNHIIGEAEGILLKNGLDMAILEPLIKETVEKALRIGPHNAQTGPARRNDAITIEKHLELLKEENTRNVYEAISKAILEKYK